MCIYITCYRLNKTNVCCHHPVISLRIWPQTKPQPVKAVWSIDPARPRSDTPAFPAF